MSGVGLLVGVDVGTKRVKAVAVDIEGVVRAEAAVSMPWEYDGSHAQIDPAAIAHLAVTVAAEAATHTRTASDADALVLGIGVTGMAETGILVDGSDRRGGRRRVDEQPGGVGGETTPVPADAHHHHGRARRPRRSAHGSPSGRDRNVSAGGPGPDHPWSRTTGEKR
ncbi:MAG: hypothetical protein ACRDT6_14485 [Micromonosporaceae bacterium]